MNYSVSKNSFYMIKDLVSKMNDYDNHGIVVNDLSANIKGGFKLMTITSQRNYLEKLRARGDATKDVIAVAKKVISKTNTFRSKKEESRLMGYRIAEKSKELRVFRKSWDKELSKLLDKLDLESKRTFLRIRSFEMDRVWNIETTLKKVKLSRKVIEIPNIHAGIMTGDKVLDEEFGAPNDTPVVEGGIIATENMLSYMRLPGKTRTFGKINTDDFIIEAEATAAKQRWSGREHHENEDDSNDGRRSRRDQEHQERSHLKGNKVSFSQLRVNDLGANKVIFMPPQLSPREEIDIEIQKLESIDTIKDFVKSKCKNGRTEHSENLTKAELLGKKEILEGIKNKDWILYSTDKSGKLVLDTR